MAFLRYLGDYGKALANSAMEVGSFGIAPDEWGFKYDTKFFKQYGPVMEKVSSALSQVGLAVATGGASIPVSAGTAGIGTGVQAATTAANATQVASSASPIVSAVSGKRLPPGGINSVSNAVADRIALGPMQVPDNAVPTTVLNMPRRTIMDKVRNAYDWVQGEGINDPVVSSKFGKDNQTDIIAKQLLSNYRKGIIASGFQTAVKGGTLLASMLKDDAIDIPRASTTPLVNLLSPVSAIEASAKARENEILASGLYTAREAGVSPEGIVAAAFNNANNTSERIAMLTSELVSNQAQINANIGQANSAAINNRDAVKANLRLQERDRKEELGILAASMLADAPLNLLGSKNSLDLARYGIYANATKQP